MAKQDRKPAVVDELAARLERLASESDIPLLAVIEQITDDETRSEIAAALARHWDFACARSHD